MGKHPEAMSLLQKHFDIALEVPDGVKKLRELILTLAMQGKLVPQNHKDPPASELLKQIESEKKRLAKEGKIRKQEPLPPIIPKEIPYELPPGWEWVRFGNITVNRDGERIPLSKDDRAHIQGEYDYYGASGVIDHINDYIFDKQLLLIGEDGANLINRSTSIAFIACGKYWVNNHAHVLDGINFDLLSFLGKYINAIDLKPYVTGTAQPKMNQEKMNSIPVSLPPLAEQRRIVAKIDRLMALCDELETQRARREEMRRTVHASAIHRLLSGDDGSWNFLERNFAELYSVTENVSELKKAILQLAVMGRLVPQDPKDPPASELLKQIDSEKKRLVKEGKIRKQEPLPPITSEEIPYELPPGWEWVRLGDITLYVQRGKSPKYSEIEKIPVIAQKCIQWHGFELFKAQFIDPTTLASYGEERFVREGDLLWNSTGLGTLGRIIVFKDKYKANYSQIVADSHVTVIRPSASISSEFLFGWFAGPTVQNEINDKSSGSTKQTELATSTVLNYAIPLPPLLEQRRIVAKIDRLMALCDELDGQIRSSREKRSVLLDAVLARM